MSWIVCLCLIALISLFAWSSALYRFRQIKNTPTSRIASAAQGYVELIGRGKPNQDAILSRYLLLPCLWYRYKMEEKRTDKKGWRTVEQGEIHTSFILQDDTGHCIVDPTHAEILTQHKDQWTKNNIRYTEWKLIIPDQLYILGEFKTLSHSAVSHQDIVREVITEWKANPQVLLKRFDADGNGEIDMDEWMLARKAAKQEASKRLAALHAAPETHLVSKPNNNQLFLISNLNPSKLATRYHLWAWFHLTAFFSALIAISRFL